MNDDAKEELKDCYDEITRLRAKVEKLKANLAKSRALCMEEAARVAMTPCPVTPHPRECEVCCNSKLIYRGPIDIAAAIRALAKETT